MLAASQAAKERLAGLEQSSWDWNQAVADTASEFWSWALCELNLHLKYTCGLPFYQFLKIFLVLL